MMLMEIKYRENDYLNKKFSFIEIQITENSEHIKDHCIHSFSVTQITRTNSVEYRFPVILSVLPYFLNVHAR